MKYNNQKDQEELEDILLRVKFNKEINDLYISLKEGKLLQEIEEKMEESDSIMINILLDSSEVRENIFLKLQVKNIGELNQKMAKDRIFKRIIKILTENDLKWEFRQNKIEDNIIKGYILQLNIYK